MHSPLLHWGFSHTLIPGVSTVHLKFRCQLENKKASGAECTIKLPRCGSFLLEQAFVIEDGFVKKAIKIFQIEYKVMMQCSIAQIPGFWNKPCCHGWTHCHSLIDRCPTPAVSLLQVSLLCGYTDPAHHQPHLLFEALLQ